MNFVDILEDTKVTPGEYILHTPTNQVVLCGAFSRDRGDIRVLSRGKMFTDKIHNFKKITMSKEERRQQPRCRSCKKV
jgi:hypothetical protein